MNIANYQRLKATGNVTLGSAVAPNEELLKIYLDGSELKYDQTFFDATTGERKTKAEQPLRIVDVQQQYGQLLQRRRELQTELARLDQVAPEYKQILTDLEALLESKP